MNWRRVLLAVLCLVLAACSAAPQPGKMAETPGGLSSERLNAVEGRLTKLAATHEAAISVGYDLGGRLVAWLNSVRGYPEFLQPGSRQAALAAVAQIFELAPEIEGVWVAMEQNELEFAYFTRAAFKRGDLAPYQGNLQAYSKVKWDAVAERYWKLENRRSAQIDGENRVAAHMKALFGERFVSLRITRESVTAVGLQVVVRGLPDGGPYAAMEEWARAAVGVTGRFFQQNEGWYLDELIWTDQTGARLLQTHMRRDSYPEWWASGMRPGRWLRFGSPMDGRAQVEMMRNLEPDRTSYRGPWWATVQSMQPALSHVSAKVPNAKVMFAGRRGGDTLISLWIELPAGASQQDAWAAQLNAALAVMTAPVAEVWIFTKAGEQISGAYLDRMGYDAIQYSDPQMPTVTPDLWPYVATIYGTPITR